MFSDDGPLLLITIMNTFQRDENCSQSVVCSQSFKETWGELSVFRFSTQTLWRKTKRPKRGTKLGKGVPSLILQCTFQELRVIERDHELLVAEPLSREAIDKYFS